MLRHEANFLRIQSLTAVMICFTRPAWAGSQPSNFLSAETAVIITFNPREFLHDYHNAPFVQRYLDQWRLAAKGDEKSLLKYYESQEIHRYEGISGQEFLERAGMIKAAFDACGNDPFEDVDLITVGYAAGDDGFLAVVVEGRFKQRNIERLVQFFHKHLFPVNQGDGPSLAMLDNETLVFANSKKTMKAMQARAGRKTEICLPAFKPCSTSGRKKHLSVVVNSLATNVNAC